MTSNTREVLFFALKYFSHFSGVSRGWLTGSSPIPQNHKTAGKQKNMEKAQTMPEKNNCVRAPLPALIIFRHAKKKSSRSSSFASQDPVFKTWD